MLDQVEDCVVAAGANRYYGILLDLNSIRYILHSSIAACDNVYFARKIGERVRVKIRHCVYNVEDWKKSLCRMMILLGK